MFHGSVICAVARGRPRDGGVASVRLHPHDTADDVRHLGGEQGGHRMVGLAVAHRDHADIVRRSKSR
jgi:hypothetical protein